jgi:photosystem II stability/assembly factor-like uncharacterized protein
MRRYTPGSQLCVLLTAFIAVRTVGGTTSAASPRSVSAPALCHAVQLGTFRFISPSIGWSLGTCDGRVAVLRTVDGGRNWRPVPGPDMREVQAGGEGVVFLNATHVWLAGLADQLRDAVTWTTDSGRSWRRTLIRVVWPPPPYYAPEFADLAFANRQDGWLATRYAGMHENISRLLRTTDGGLQWRVIAVGPGISAIIGFATPSVGFGVSSQGGGAPPIVYRSSNGGRTWQPHALPLPTIYRHIHLTMGFGPLQSSGPERLTLPAVINQLDLGSHASLMVYRSSDRGLHWTGGATLNLGQSASEVSNAFANASDGWAITLSGLYRTVDAGRSWSKMVTSLTFHPGITLDFASTRVGFALVPKGNGQILLRTDDSGRTWHQLWRY